jgi:predicted nucleic acid-binding protein
VPVHEYRAAAAEEFGRVRVDLRRAGRPIPQIDAQIAAIARLDRLTVLTTDSHFTAVPQLHTENWRS